MLLEYYAEYIQQPIKNVGNTCFYFYQINKHNIVKLLYFNGGVGHMLNMLYYFK